ncbi:hypothetical protein [Bacteroides gallinarum]|uniref:hypothetical protein n=1 Tax=Bacteroides gallinarum TaxID=376806 RepID=UPI000370B2A1|nr:hypothetical protein [Bacteroides gallinarum]
MDRKKKTNIILKDIRHKNGIYYKEQQAMDMATFMLRGMSQKEAYALIKARYR